MLISQFVCDEGSLICHHSGAENVFLVYMVRIIRELDCTWALLLVG